MGLLSWLFGSPPKWFAVSEKNFPEITNLNKTDAKKLLRNYLEHCGFDKEYIREEIESFSDDTTCDEELLREQVDDAKELLRETKQMRAQIKKTGKDEDGTALNPEGLKEKLEDLDADIASEQESLQEAQAELKDFKTDKLPSLIQYINQRARGENEPEDD